jgi:hypothetical protein
MTAEQRLAGILSGEIPVRAWGFIEYNTGYPNWRAGKTGFCFEYIPQSQRISAQSFKVCNKQNYTYSY